jgi:hypothetical protein
VDHDLLVVDLDRAAAELVWDLQALGNGVLYLGALVDARGDSVGDVDEPSDVDTVL